MKNFLPNFGIFVQSPTKLEIDEGPQHSRSHASIRLGSVLLVEAGTAMRETRECRGERERVLPG